MSAENSIKIPRKSFVVSAFLVSSVIFGVGHAAAGPFSSFPGAWSGTGTIELSDGRKERMRCQATYRARGAEDRTVDLQLGCASDSYKFQLTGDLVSQGEQISGQWSETTRNIGGSAIGRIRGERMQLHVETGGFAANLSLQTKGKSQSVNIDSQGGGERIKANITLRRN